MNTSPSAKTEADVLFQQGYAQHKAGQLPAAATIYQRVLAHVPDHQDSLHLLGCVHLAKHEYAKAIALISRAIAVGPPTASMHFNLGRALEDSKNFAAALVQFQVAEKMAPKDAATQLGIGNSFAGLLQWPEAVEAYDKAIALKPRYLDAWLNKAFALKQLKRLHEVLVSLEQVLAINPQHALALSNIGQILFGEKKYGPATAALMKSWAIPGADPTVLGHLVRTKAECCDWDGLGDMLRQLESRLLQGQDISPPLVVARVLNSNKAMTAASRMRAKAVPMLAAPAFKRQDQPNERIKLGYFSSDLHSNHPVYLALAGVLALHDSATFDVHIYKLPHDKPKPLPDKLVAQGFKTFDLGEMTQLDALQLVRSHGLDIAVDLNGFTMFAQTELFKARVAPVQVNYLGFPGTMGGAGHDYVIADQHIIPEAFFTDYDEKVVWMPHSFFPVDNARATAGDPLTRASHGLPEGGFVYCSFCSHDRISQGTFASWMNILKAVPDSVLWLKAGQSETMENLRKAAKAKGIAPARLVFAPKTTRNEDHLARLAFADLALDSQPYNAHMTALDAITAGIPLLTYSGETFAGRVAGSLLLAADMPELLCSSRSQFEKRAIALAKSPDELATLRKKLVAARDTAPLFNSASYARALEKAFRHMAGLARRGEAPAPFAVQDLPDSRDAGA